MRAGTTYELEVELSDHSSEYKNKGRDDVQSGGGERDDVSDPVCDYKMRTRTTYVLEEEKDASVSNRDYKPRAGATYGLKVERQGVT